MDYEKKYNDALNLAKSYYGKDNNEFLDTMFPELRESEDERIRKGLLEVVSDIAGGWPFEEHRITKKEAIAYLEKQKEQKPLITGNDFGWIDELKHDLKHPEELDEKVQEVLKKRQKPVERSLEDDHIIGFVYDLLNEIECKDNWAMSKKECLERLKSLSPQSKDETYKEKDEAFKLGKHQLAVTFMKYLDDNRPDGKMGLSNGECEDIDKAFKENDWAKIMRYIEKYRPHWKPSEEQMFIQTPPGRNSRNGCSICRRTN